MLLFLLGDERNSFFHKQSAYQGATCGEGSLTIPPKTILKGTERLGHSTVSRILLPFTPPAWERGALSLLSQTRIGFWIHLIGLGEGYS